MPNIQQAARWERFVQMRLEGRSDLTYRAYDLLSKERKRAGIKLALDIAGQYIPAGNTIEALTNIQHWIKGIGFGIHTLGEIENLLQEFYMYQKIRWYGYKKCPYRDSDLSLKMYNENEQAEKYWASIREAHGFKAGEKDE